MQTAAFVVATLATVAVSLGIVWKLHQIVMENGTSTQEWFYSTDYEDNLVNRYKFNLIRTPQDAGTPGTESRLNGVKIALFSIGTIATTFILTYVFAVGLVAILPPKIIP